MTRLSVNFARDVVPNRTALLAARETSRQASQRGTVHALFLALVWLTCAASGVVLSEPAPVDALALLLVVALPIVGLTTTTPLLMAFVAGWLVCAAAGTYAATQSQDVARASIHAAVSLYLYMLAFVFAGFVARRPRQHGDLILSGMTFAAALAAIAGIAGYVGAFPGAADLFVRAGRMTGTFADPNMFGAFLVPGVLYLLHLALDRPAGKALLSLALAGTLTFAVLASFSHGASVNLAVGSALFAGLTLLTAEGPGPRARLAGFLAAGMILLAMATLGAVRMGVIGDLLHYRTGLGGDTSLANGAAQYAGAYHHEAAHGVYVGMVGTSGLIGGMVYLALVLATLVLGGWRLTQSFATRPLLVVAYAAFVAAALEGAFVDSSHWRHVYLLMALVWGLLPVADGDDGVADHAG